MPKITILEGNNDDKDKIRIFMVKGEKGATGNTGNGIASIEKTATVGNIDTYTITFTNGATYDFNVANGDGATIVVDNLTDTSSVKALSANQGYILKGLIDGLDTDKLNVTDIIDNLNSTATNKPLSANQGKELKEYIDNFETSNITNLEADLTLVDGTEPTLEDGYYYTNGFNVKVNGTTDTKFNEAIFYFSNNRLSVAFSYNNNILNNNLYYYIKYDTNNDEWTSSYVKVTNTITGVTSEVPTSYAVKNALQRHIITAYNSTAYVIQNDGESEIIPLSQFSNVGSKLSVSQNGILIGSGINYIKISATVQFGSLTPNTEQIGRSVSIYRNSDIIKRMNVDYETLSSCIFTDILIPVSSGDKITLQVLGGAGDTLAGTPSRNSYITVETVG